jgi:hypothetical protein
MTRWVTPPAPTDPFAGDELRYARQGPCADSRQHAVFDERRHRIHLPKSAPRARSAWPASSARSVIGPERASSSHGKSCWMCRSCGRAQPSSTRRSGAASRRPNGHRAKVLHLTPHPTRWASTGADGVRSRATTPGPATLRIAAGKPSCRIHPAVGDTSAAATRVQGHRSVLAGPDQIDAPMFVKGLVGCVGAG